MRAWPPGACRGGERYAAIASASSCGERLLLIERGGQAEEEEEHGRLVDLMVDADQQHAEAGNGQRLRVLPVPATHRIAQGASEAPGDEEHDGHAGQTAFE